MLSAIHSTGWLFWRLINQCAWQHLENRSREWPEFLAALFQGRVLNRGYGVLSPRRRYNSWVKLGSVKSQLNHLPLPRKGRLRLVFQPGMVLLYKWIVLSNFPKRTKRIYRGKSHQPGDCLGWYYINLPQKGVEGDGSSQEGMVIISQWLTAPGDSMCIHGSALHPSAS